ncbi:MAG: phosphate/phosphite/phosphonate ABC transporter substrate-binding protein [Betaproteobacteria bacterium]|nr:PhnD/SsuA/transferrin family substrate-binding protein [Rhodocyclaceae bacterium]MCE2723833.1 phosphate/phosphite/phosphonate ABC transporter substrate-binding protein [Betaproteobacteria bacterium]
MNTKKILLTALLLTLGATGASVDAKTEGKTPTTTSQDAFQEREAILSTMRDRAVLTVGIFPGTTSFEAGEVYNLVRRYMPLANYLSKESGKLVALMPEKNVLSLKRRAVSERYPYIYVNAEVAASANLAGYVPLVARAQDIVSVFVTKSDSKVATIEDLKGKTVGLVDQAMVSTLAKHALHKQGLWTSVKLLPAGSSGTAALTLMLDTGQAEAVVMRKENADEVIKAKPGYKVAIVGSAAPGFLLMARRNVAEADNQRMAAALLKVNRADKSFEKVAVALDVLADGPAFRRINDTEVKGMVGTLTDMAALEPARNYIVKPK